MRIDFQDTYPMPIEPLQDREPKPKPEPDPEPEPERHKLSFHGTGAGYFRIWLVNLALSVITLGIYSPWAKVRAQRYFHENTTLDGSHFGYHATQRSILLGRGLLAVLLLSAVVLGIMGSLRAVLPLLGMVLLVPWLLASAMRFKARMVSWRGVRFAWTGSTVSVYLRTLKVGLLMVLTFGVYYYAAVHRFRRLHLQGE